ncbi:MAG: hypothetical protein ABI402_10595 [Ferruginibacter sp.]
MINSINNTNTNNQFVVKLSALYIIAFISLRHIIHELHEFAHMIVGRLLCGTWGTRDFNNVHPMSDAYLENHTGSSLLGMEGPFVNYFLIWAGAFLIVCSNSSKKKSWGLTIIFASLPFARLFTAVIGGGDEYGVIKTFISNPTIARFVLIAIIISVLFYPLYVAYQTFRNTRFKVQLFSGFLILPMLLEGMVVLLFFNSLLKVGVLNTHPFMGSPLLVYVVLLVAVIAFVFSAKNIKSLVSDLPQKNILQKEKVVV